MARPLRPLLAALALLGLLACSDDTAAGAGGSGGGGGDAPGGSPAAGGGGEAPLGGGGAGEGGQGATGGSFEGVDPLQGAAQPELVQGGFAFTEGTVFLPALGVLRFSDIPANEILQLDLASDEISVWRSDSAGTNGNALTPEGELIMCEHVGRRIARSPAAAPAPVTVVDRYLDQRFNSPNDAIVRSDGTLYFTDPTYGLGGAPQEIPFQGVFRVTSAGEVALVDDGFSQPNGIALSPDEQRLYVSDSQAGGLFVYDVAADGSTGPGSQLIDVGPSDGMAVDDAGNLYLTTAAGVEVYDDAGAPWGVITLPEQPANCAFGGPDRRTLFITARTGLYRVDLAVPGKP